MWIRGRALTVRLGAAAIAVASMATVGGCKGARQPPPGASAPTSSVVPQQQQSCETVKIGYETKLRDQHVRCALSIDNLTLDVSSDPAWAFSLHNAGTVIQQFNEPAEDVGETGVVPLMQDIDGSGTPVLLVVTDRGGTGGEPMAVWRLSGAPPRFVRAGELFGFRHFYRTSEGFFGNYAHSSAVAGSVTLYRWVDDKLVTVAVLDTQGAAVGSDSHGWVRNDNVLCALNQDDDPPGARARRTAALEAAGVDPTTAQERFCTQPWVASIYR